MSAAVKMSSTTESNLSYRFLRIASERFDTTLAELNDTQRQEVERIAEYEEQLEHYVLTSPEASQVTVPEGQARLALKQLKERYENAEDFSQALDSINILEDELCQTLQRSLRVEAVLELISSRERPVTETDARLFYYLHHERFSRPERRTARHILLTINEDVEGSDETSVARKAEEIYKRLKKNPNRFSEQALKHSECPTGLNGGVLGEITRDVIYPELEKQLFQMQEGELSPPVLTELGLHILLCDQIHPQDSMPLHEALPQLIETLQQRQNRRVQRQWITQRMKDSGDSNKEALS